MNRLSKIFSNLLILYFVFMFLWGLLGFLEYFTGVPFIVELQNPTFPAGTQFLHWLLISMTGATYLIGYCLRWAYTPQAMVVLFAMLASMCFIQTFDFMTSPNRYWAYAVECSLYLILSTYLLRSQRMQKRFVRAD